MFDPPFPLRIKRARIIGDQVVKRNRIRVRPVPQNSLEDLVQVPWSNKQSSAILARSTCRRSNGRRRGCGSSSGGSSRRHVTTMP